MISLAALILFSLTSFSNCKEYTFPDNFKFGVATSAYQVEGAWNVGGKGENIWDYMTHTNPSSILDKSNGDIACDSYNKIKEDVQLLKNLGVDFYRFSISWSRILPSGKTEYINPDGIRYYNELIDELLANNIEPLVTMHHFDLPQPLEEEGGFLNLAIADYFEDYADVLYKNFGDRVKEWTTFNEPTPVCFLGYSGEFLAPMITRKDGGYLCGRTLLIAHAKAYHLYNKRYRASQKGRIGIVHNIFWFEPRTNSIKDLQAAEAANEFNFGWFANPIFSKEGDYPQIMKGSIEYASKQEGLPKSRLPELTQEEIELIKGSADFLGINHYTTFYCSPIEEEGIGKGLFYLPDMDANCVMDEKADGSASFWLKVIPSGFRNSLNWIKEQYNNPEEQYNNPEVIILENGISDDGNLLNDCLRVNYNNLYLTEMLKAIHEDGCNVSGYAAWSFMDNFEWTSGYTQKFGLYSVDFDDPARPRTPKMSAFVFKNIIQERKINWTYTPEGFGKCDGPKLKDEL
ncbi:Glycosyl hydrolase family 1 [Popillia japonica]|uniref:beta-glucosidase n=1 Tax=Popillia japonica TaxID=7064 RepID=A0AAW1ID36_POPJA